MGKRIKKQKRPHTPIYPSLESAWQAILSRRRVTTKAGCWEWTGARKNGRGIMNVAGQTYYVYRIAAHVVLGMSTDSELIVCHHCDNPLCYNPKHLFVGTQKDNVADMWKKGRNSCKAFPGILNGSCRLTVKSVLAIRAQRNQGVKLQTLSKKYGVSETQISRIALNKSWKHLGGGNE